MNENVVELKNILTEELSVYQKLLELAKDKTKLLVDRKLTELQATVEQEENLVQRLIELEPLRQEQVNAIVGEPIIKLDVLVGTGGEIESFAQFDHHRVRVGRAVDANLFLERLVVGPVQFPELVGLRGSYAAKRFAGDVFRG